MASKASTEAALQMLRNLPRVSLGNLRPLPEMKRPNDCKRGRKGGKRGGRGNKGQGQRNTLPPLGFEGGTTPFHKVIPKEPYYYGHHVRRQHPPLSLLSLQRMIDTGRIDVSKPIDLTTLCNTGLITIRPEIGHSGIQLTEEGADIFDGKVNIEVQRASELVIAAIEKNGGTIINKFYDQISVDAMRDPARFFSRGVPIPRCKLPPQDAVEYYSSAPERGYLADPALVQLSREELAQKYGYPLPDLTQDPLYEMLTRRKDPRQIWYGLAPGWVVNLRDKTILKPIDEEYVEYYQS